MSLDPASRAALYRLFARLLTEPPGPALLAALRADGVREVFARAEPGFGPWLDGLTPEAEADARVAFARLFLVPKGAAPFASAWLDGERERVADQLATLTHRTMAALGMEQTGRQGNLSLDHLGLTFAVAAEALADDEPARRALGEHFEAQALGPWVDTFAAALARQADHPLYAALARLISATRGTTP